MGRNVLKLPKGELRLEENQAAAAVGQIALARVWADALARRHKLTGAQVLLTLGDTEERRRYLNARATIAKLLELRAVPIINENDTVATTEIRYGDNDRLAARVATMTSADLLVLLSDVDGLYDAPPNEKKDAKLIPVVSRVTAEIEHMAGAAGPSFRAAACAPRSRRPRSPPARASTWSSPRATSCIRCKPLQKAAPAPGSHAGQSRHRAQALDRRQPRAARRDPYRRGRGRRPPPRQEPAACGRRARRRRVRPRRRGPGPRTRGCGSRARPRRL
jgi:hypothetical protein